MINVTKTFLPPFEEYAAILKRAWNKGWITNNGELVQELEEKLRQFFGVKHLLYCSNGTVVLQMALRALNVKGEVITTPFSYVATADAIAWENCTPVFVDIDSKNYCINADLIENAITGRTQAILATHVYGYPCNIEKIEKIAQKHQLKVIYDGAHAFGCKLNGKSLLSYGDVSTCSFHATKLFHTVEGGCVICEDEGTFKKLYLYRQFGHIYDEYLDIGINAKNSEFHAAMGLSLFPKIDSIIQSRQGISRLYDQALSEVVARPNVTYPEFEYNFGYYPIVLSTEAQLLSVRSELEKQNVFSRRYFFPSLNELPYFRVSPCPISEDISRRVLCLPLFPGLEDSVVNRITEIIKTTLNEI